MAYGPISGGLPRLCIAAVIVALALGPPFHADTEGFSSFYRDFRGAAARDDARALAGLTKLPFLFDGQARDRVGLLAVLPQLFTPEVRDCLAAAEPIREGPRYVVFCRPYGFYFGPDNGAWRLEEFSADGEDLP